ncbi:MAG: oxygenase MpaB family protein [Aeromicrobium erythreum]
MRLRPLPRDHWQREIDRLDPETDYEQIARILGTHEFPWDVEQALSFALFRTYAIPTVGRLLAATDEFTERTQKRHDDTVLVLEAVLVGGMESADGRAAVRRMNQMHGSYDISNEDMLYVLSTFVVMPVRWIDRYGYRPLREAEVVALTRYYQRLGRLMGIRDVPPDYAAFERLLDEDEARRFAYDPGARAVADATLTLFTTFFPRPLRRFMHLFARALMDDHLLRAFGYARPPAWFRDLAHRSLALRGRLVSRLPARRRPFRAASSHRVRSYPGGFLVEHLGTFPDEDPGRRVA